MFMLQNRPAIIVNLQQYWRLFPVQSSPDAVVDDGSRYVMTVWVDLWHEIVCLSQPKAIMCACLFHLLHQLSHMHFHL